MRAWEQSQLLLLQNICFTIVYDHDEHLHTIPFPANQL